MTPEPYIFSSPRQSYQNQPQHQTSQAGQIWPAKMFVVAVWQDFHESGLQMRIIRINVFSQSEK
ncbi:MAG: hypothetical protein CMQ10_01970 [Gammaproteobacteria bacterium]|jgi:hypothetical protein|nr:hypothetical protein [Gammaproteobacteria bacterium]|tara:strand:+ start:287 stop:478 length:192 start_codon:yes stop_codon:yes gene_type:complete